MDTKDDDPDKLFAAQSAAFYVQSKLRVSVADGLFEEQVRE